MPTTDSIGLCTALRTYNKVRRNHWLEGTYIYYIGKTIMIKRSREVVQKYLANKTDLEALDWKKHYDCREHHDYRELCNSCISTKKLKLERAELNITIAKNSWDVTSYETPYEMALLNSVTNMVEHIKMFHPCTCNNG